jgi:hypothetical protein
MKSIWQIITLYAWSLGKHQHVRYDIVLDGNQLFVMNIDFFEYWKYKNVDDCDYATVLVGSLALGDYIVESAKSLWLERVWI